MPYYFAEGDLPWVFDLSEASALTDLLANLPTYTRKHCGLLHLGDNASEDALEMLSIALVGQELTNFCLLLERIPPDPTLLRGLHAGGMQVGVYLPTEQAKIGESQLTVVLQTAERLATLRKLHTLLGGLFVLTDAGAVLDVRHYTELIAPYVSSILFLNNSENSKAKMLKQYFAIV